MANKRKLERFRKVTVTSERGDVARDVEIKAREDQPGITKEDVRQIARLGYEGVAEGDAGPESISRRQTIIKRIRQWGMSLGSAFLIRRPSGETAILLSATDVPLDPKEAQLEEISLDKGSKSDPYSVINQLTPRQAKERLTRLYDRFGIPKWIGIHPKIDE